MRRENLSNGTFYISLRYVNGWDKFEKIYVPPSVVDILCTRYNPLRLLRARVWQWYSYVGSGQENCVQLLRERLSRLPRSSAPLRMHLFDSSPLFLSLSLSSYSSSYFFLRYLTLNIEMAMLRVIPLPYPQPRGTKFRLKARELAGLVRKKTNVFKCSR